MIMLGLIAIKVGAANAKTVNVCPNLRWCGNPSPGGPLEALADPVMLLSKCADGALSTKSQESRGTLKGRSCRGN